MTSASAPTSEGSRRRLAWVVMPLVVFVGIAAVLYVGLRSGDPSVLPSALVGKPAPEFDLAPLDGLTVDGRPAPGLATSDLAAGRVTLVNIWASWCAPCREEHPVLTELAAAGVPLVGINYKDDPENALGFLADLGNPFAAVGVDDKGRSAIDWGVYGVPETFVVDGSGVIRHKHVGPLSPEAGAALKEMVGELAAGG